MKGNNKPTPALSDGSLPFSGPVSNQNDFYMPLLDSETNDWLEALGKQLMDKPLDTLPNNYALYKVHVNK